jgi:hypothetical protein
MRGNNRQDVFLRENYLFFLRAARLLLGERETSVVLLAVSVVCYRQCESLPPAASTARRHSISHMQRLSISYKAMNEGFDRAGPLFQGQFQAIESTPTVPAASHATST